MIRPWQIAAALGACFVVVLAAMGWATVTVLRLQDREVRARSQVALEKAANAAIRRMDAFLMDLAAEQSTHPFEPADSSAVPMGPGSELFGERRTNEVVAPSLPFSESSPFVRLRFRVQAYVSGNALRAPAGELRWTGLANYADLDKARRAAEDLGALHSRVKAEVFARAFLKEPGITNVLLGSSGAVESPMKYIWADGLLLLVREVTERGRTWVEGCWLDWPALKRHLLAGVRDLLPSPELDPIPAPSLAIAHTMATLPAWLNPGSLPAEPAPWLTPLRFSLLLAWVSVLLAGAVAGVLVAEIVLFSERRGAFVTAVTHELRTPLTTLKMYTEMLSQEMVVGDQARREYLATLRSEAERLAHLVENVMAYSRLERGRYTGRVEAFVLRDAVAATLARMEETARRAGFDLRLEEDEAIRGTRVKWDRFALEQIVVNLVNNACKYAASATDRRIHVQIGRQKGAAVVTVRDHGPGVSPEVIQRLFREFSKSANEAADSAPGIGLGLALSRRLARRMGGDLRLDGGVTDGACFELTIPFLRAIR